MTQRQVFIFLAALVCITFPTKISGGLTAQQREAQTTGQLKEADLKVNTVGLSASYDDVRQRLGEPQRMRRDRVPGKFCGAPHTELTINYPGLKVGLYGTLAGRNFRVVSIEVTSLDWEAVRGVRIGMEEMAVRERLGKPEIDFADSGGRGLMYKTAGDSFVGLVIRGGKLVSIEMALPCAKRLPNNSFNRTRK
jgi:hypothetical protein